MSDTIIPSNFGRIITRKAVAANYTIHPSDDYVVVSVTGKVLTLPAASAVPAGWVVECGVTANGTISATVVPNGTDTIGGHVGAVTITSTTGKIVLVSDGVSNFEASRAAA